MFSVKNCDFSRSEFLRLHPILSGLMGQMLKYASSQVFGPITFIFFAITSHIHGNNRAKFYWNWLNYNIVRDTFDAQTGPSPDIVG